MIYTKTFPSPPICRQEILRYAGCGKSDAKTEALLDACLQEAEQVLTYRVCWTILGEIPPYEDLKAVLADSKKVVLFAATVGVGLDRLLTKYSARSPAKALMLQAIGAERIESLCDAFCKELAKAEGLCPTMRFSPGYGRVPLDAQKDIFATLQPMQRIGLGLTDSLLMTPTKSVTAWFGLTEQTQNTHSKCSLCQNADCRFRSTL